MALDNGSLALVTNGGTVQFRSAIGEWSSVVQLPFKYVYSSAPDEDGVLVAGSRPANKEEMDAILSKIDPNREMAPSFREHAHAEVALILSISIDGHIRRRWAIPNAAVQSLASWGGRRWATILRGVVELLPTGEVSDSEEQPTVERQIHGRRQQVVPADIQLFIGRSGERIFCAPEECDHDGPCHYAACFRRDQPSWHSAGHWTSDPIACGSYLLEPERKGSNGDLRHDRDRLTIRRLADGVETASISLEQNVVVTCGGSHNEFLIAGATVQSYEPATGRRNWSVRIRSGRATAIARAKDCVVVLTSRGKQQNICRAASETSPPMGSRRP
jgi:hypothetical protein